MRAILFVVGCIACSSSGDPGPAGEPGDPGVDGAPGLAGAEGADGNDGTDGADGTDGNDGTDGAPGIPAGPRWVDGSGATVPVVLLTGIGAIVADASGVMWSADLQGEPDPVTYIDYLQYLQPNCQGDAWVVYVPGQARTARSTYQHADGTIYVPADSAPVAMINPASQQVADAPCQNGPNLPGSGAHISLSGATTVSLPAAPLFTPPLHPEP